MKKTVITTLILLFASVCFRADAGLVIVDYQGPTFIQSYGIERNMVVNSNDNGVYNVAVRPLEDALSSTDGRVRIPLEYVFINNNREDIFMRYNEFSTIFKNVEMNGIPRNMIARVRGYGMVPAGTYNLNFEIQAVDSATQVVVSSSTFNMQFVVPAEQRISFSAERPKITVGVNDAFAKHKKITSDTNPMIYINSNTDWKLILNTDNFGDKVGNYYIRTIAASPNVKERLQERVQITEGREIVIAKGKAPANNEYVAVEYSLESADGKMLKPGRYDNKLRFILREDKGI